MDLIDFNNNYDISITYPVLKIVNNNCNIFRNYGIKGTLDCILFISV